MPLNATEMEVITAQVVTETTDDALVYLKDHDQEMHRSTYYRTLARLDVEVPKRLFDIAKNGKKRHMQRIDEIETIRKKLWKIHNEATDNNVKLRALRQLTALQPWISAYDESTASVIREVIKNFGQEIPESQTPSIPDWDGRRDQGRARAKTS